MLKNLRYIPQKELTLNITATWACMMSRSEHTREADLP